MLVIAGALVGCAGARRAAAPLAAPPADTIAAVMLARTCVGDTAVPTAVMGRLSGETGAADTAVAMFVRGVLGDTVNGPSLTIDSAITEPARRRFVVRNSLQELAPIVGADGFVRVRCLRRGAQVFLIGRWAASVRR